VDLYKLCRASLQNYYSMIESALQRLSAANPHLTILMPASRQTCTANTQACPGLQWVRPTQPNLSWLIHENCLKAAAPGGTTSVDGHIAPFDKVTEPNQQISINGWPVFGTLIHSYIHRTHTAMSTGKRRRPTKQLTVAKAAYILRVTLPPAEVTFTGSVLNESALFSMSPELEGLVASVLHEAWRVHMPATVLFNIEKAMATGVARSGHAAHPASNPPRMVDAELGVAIKETGRLKSSAVLTLQPASIAGPSRKRLLRQVSVALQKEHGASDPMLQVHPSYPVLAISPQFVNKPIPTARCISSLELYHPLIHHK
jgi:hypothetical protein